MKTSKSTKIIAALLCAFMLVGIIPFTALAATGYNQDSATTSDHYYNVVSKKDWEIAPGISETEIQFKSKDGSRNQRAHIMVADMNNEYTKVTTSYTNMDTSVYRTSTMVEQAQAAINLGWNVVGTMNTCLSWYTNYPAEHVNEPLGFMMIDGETVWDLTKQYGGVGFPECLVINKVDSDSPRVEIRAIRSLADLNGDEEQVIPCSSGYMVKNGKNVAGSPNHSSGSSAPRSVVGVTADGKVVIMMNDGRASFSDGMTPYEIAEIMLDFGCEFAVNCDGGGSSTFLSKRPGEELEVHCTPSDGSLRTNTSGILFVSTAPADGNFALAHITTEIDNKYYAPNSTVKFNVLGTDLVGTEVDVPDDAVWTIKEDNMGTISDGIFVSNGTPGTVTAQVEYDGKVVGAREIEIVVPTQFAFTTRNFAVKFGTSYELTTVATVNNGINEVVLPEGVVSITCSNAGVGTIDGTLFSAVSEVNAPADKTSTITATLSGTTLTATAKLTICREITEIVESFDDGIAGWNVKEVYGTQRIPNSQECFTISAANSENGQVHDGNGSMRVYLDVISDGTPLNGGSWDYAQVMLYPDYSIELQNVESYGFWVYVPVDFLSLTLQMRYLTDNNNDGIYETLVKAGTKIKGSTLYNDWSESGWYFISCDVGGKNILLPGKYDAKARTGGTINNDEVTVGTRVIEFQIQPAHEDQNFYDGKGTVNGRYTFYVDSLTVDYAKDVADRVAPKFGTITLLSEAGDNDKEMKNHTTVSSSANVLNVSAAVSDDGDGLNPASAKAYVDGMEVPCNYTDGCMNISNIAVADGPHRIKFEIADRAGNTNVAVRLVNVESGDTDAAIVVEPKDSTLDRIYYGSVYWMNVKAKAIETIDTITTVIDINSVNHWELDHIELAAGFTATYSVDSETNTAAIFITRTGKNTQSGEVVIASLPIRIVDLDHDIRYRGFTAEEYWAGKSTRLGLSGCEFWEQDLKVDVLSGFITFVEGYASNVLNTFSNEEFSVDTETFRMYKTMVSNYTDYYNAHGAVHTHTVEAIDDKEATAYENGYANRTFCSVCNSVVDWGTTISAIGHEHTYVLVDGKFICSECQEEYNVGTGLFEMNGNTYYGVAGSLMTGWQNVEDFWYYFDVATKAAVEGQVKINNRIYTFEDHVLIRGAWNRTSNGLEYYWAGSRLESKWMVVDGKTYFFSIMGYAVTGTQFIGESRNSEPKCYVFDDNGALIEAVTTTGLYDANGYTYYLENGVAKKGIQVIDGSYYYFNSSYHMLLNQKKYVDINAANGHVTPGYCYIGADGRFLDSVVADPDGAGDTYFLIGRPAGKGVWFDWNNHRYYTTYEGKVNKNDRWIDDVYYYFDSTDGHLIDHEFMFRYDTKYYCIGGLIQKTGMTEIDGKTYYLSTNSGRVIFDCTYWVVGDKNPTGVDQLYFFNEDGCLRDKELYMVEGSLCYMLNGLRGKVGLFYLDGNLYYASTNSGVIKTGKYYVSEANANGMEGDCYYYFGADGKALKEELLKDGSNTYYIVDGRPFMGGLTLINNDYYYFSTNSGAMRTGRYYVTDQNTNGLMPGGWYTFDADGKMIMD